MSARSIARLSSLLAFIALATTACSIGKPVPQPTTYIVEPSPPERLSLAHGKEVARMGNVRLAAAFAGSSLIYRTDDVTFVSDPYQAFIADPSAMFGTQMAAWLDRAGPFKAVTQPDSALSAKYRLEATVTELYGDFRPGRPATAVMAVQFALVDVDAIGPGLLFERTIARRVPLEGASPSALVRGYNRAVTEILSELAGDLAAKGLR